MLRPPPERTPVKFSKRNARRLWILTALDMVAVAWMIALGTWLDQTSRLTAVITLGGHHVLVLIMAAAGFLTLASGAVLTNGFRHASKLRLALITARCRRHVILNPLVKRRGGAFVVVLGRAGGPGAWPRAR
jgi:hypothetical protein